MIEKLGSKEFNRLRIGVNRPTNQGDVSDYVLSTFRPEEKKLIEDQQSTIENIINEFLK
ncbi:hypothetical protein KKG31_03470 [Patescibacteria group bacterium]|nr:hypothetical protein [Patescibacteria group bacterium]MBU1758207.1 hypothetical protein [Patescibacteria group bacterium]